MDPTTAINQQLAPSGYTVDHIKAATQFAYGKLRELADQAGNLQNYPPWEDLDTDDLAGMCCVAQMVAQGEDILANFDPDSGAAQIVAFMRDHVQAFLLEHCRQ